MELTRPPGGRMFNPGIGDLYLMPRLEQWELLGLLLSVGGAAFGIAYVAPSLLTLNVTFRGVAGFSAGPQASLGLAGLSVAALGSLAAMIIGQLRPSGGSAGASLIIWINLIVLVLGDLLFYLNGIQETVVLLFGVSSAFLTVIALWIISRRSLALGTR
jgi:hypothetical protein